jgi:hypothetical protein
MAEGKKEKLTAELEKINFYGREICAGKSEAELEKTTSELKAARRTIKNIFNYKIMGEV